MRWTILLHQLNKCASHFLLATDAVLPNFINGIHGKACLPPKEDMLNHFSNIDLNHYLEVFRDGQHAAYPDFRIF